MSEINERYLRSEDGKRQFKYFAFISYKHADEAVAKKLKKMLELYRLPMRLCKEADRPKRLTPICRDEDNWSVGPDVYTHMDQKLGESKFLIVVCSRNMQSNTEFIDYEIRKFIELGNPVSHILPLIIDGEGCARDPSNEAFPPALLEMDEHIRPRGARMNPKKPRPAILELVATMHGIERTELQSIDRERRQRRVAYSLAACLLLFVFLASFMAWEVLSVKQARLREQNVYAKEYYEQGNRKETLEIAESILSETNIFMDNDIEATANRLKFLASVSPLLSPKLMLETAYSNTNAEFTENGEQIIVESPDRILIYNTDGELVLEAETTRPGESFTAVSSDGKYAVTLSVFEESDEIVLWLYSVAEEKRVCRLVSVEEKHLDDKDATAGRYDTVVDAAFSPNSALVCAYRTGGYYNSSSALEVYSATDGKAVVSLDAALLGDVGQGNVIQSFEFLSDTVFHWEGPWYHVIHNIESGTTYQIAKSELTTSGRGVEAAGHLRLLPVTADDGKATLQLCNFMSDKQTEEISLGQYSVKSSDCEILGNRYALALARDESGLTRQIVVVDMNSMKPLYLDYPLSYDLDRWKAAWVDDSSVIYLNFFNNNKDGCRLIKIDASKGTVAELENTGDKTNGATVKLLGRSGDTDWFLCQEESKTVALAVMDNHVESYYLDEPYSVFASSARMGKGDRLVAIHNNKYALYPLANPGSKVDSEVDWCGAEGEAHLAISDDGNTIVKGLGAKVLIYSTEHGAVELNATDTVQAVSITANGDKIIFADSHNAWLCKKDGTVLNTASVEKFLFRDVRFIPDGSRVLIAATPADIGKLAYDELWLLDGDTLETISNVTKVYHPNGVAEDVVYGKNCQTQSAFDVSADSKYFAVVETDSPVVIYGMEPNSRVVTIFSAKDGKRIASGPVKQDDAALLDMKSNTSQSVGFSYVRFAKSGNLLAGFSNGLWVIDMESFDTRYVSASSDFCALPEELPSGKTLYLGDGLQISDASMPSRIYAVDGDFKIHTSKDNSWIFVISKGKTELIYSEDVSVRGTFSNQAADVLYMDECRIVYNTTDGLYIIEL